jgi:hypothetical protein
MCKCAEGFQCDSDQSRAVKALESKGQVMLDTIAKLDFKLTEANVLLSLYRDNAIAAGLEEERLHKEIERLSNWHNPFRA